MKAAILSAALALASVSASNAGGTAQYDPYLGFNGGYRYSDGSTAQYDPYLGFNGGYRFSNGGTAKYDPYLGFNGGWRFDDGYGQ